MSIHVTSTVWRHFVGTGGELLLALALADYADDAGESIFPSIQTLAAKTRQSESTVKRQLREFRASGWLLSVAGASGGRHNTREHRINPDWLKGVSLAPFQHPIGKKVTVEKVLTGC